METGSSIQPTGRRIFANPHRAGTQSYWLGSLLRAHVKPALVKAGICTQRRASQNREADFGGRFRTKARHTDSPIAHWTLTDPDSKQGFRVSSLDRLAYQVALV